MYCTKCKTNWAALHSDTLENEVYEYCPKCKTDSHLENEREGDKFILCPFSGRVKNITTGKYVLQKPKVFHEKHKPFDINKWKEDLEEKQRLEDIQINKYIQVYKEKGPEEAIKVFYNK